MRDELNLKARNEVPTPIGANTLINSDGTTPLCYEE